MPSAPPARRAAPHLFVTTCLVLALLVSTSGVANASTASKPVPGNPGQLDPPDPYFPALGNRGYDVEHYDLSIGYDTPTGAIRGDTKIDARAHERLTRFNLDLAGLDVASVTVDGHRAAFRHSAVELRVLPRTPIDKDAAFTVRVLYSGVPDPGKIPSIGYQNSWLTTSDGITTLNEPDGARRWFPSNDHPSDKATFAFHVDVPTPLVAVANGTLESKVVRGPRTTWNWNENAPMTTYLSQLAIGNLDLRNEAPVDGVGIRNAYAPKVAPQAAAAARQTPDMLRFLSSWFGKYPFSTYGIMVPDGGPRGLAFEAQTFSLISSDTFRNPGLASAILAHELTHQWFGDSVSPAAWNHVWLNEGFATYGEWLWSDHALNDPLQVEVDRAVRAVGRTPEVAADDPGLDHLFGSAPYDRGGLTLHALRLKLGDATFAQILRTYAQRFNGKSATTEDFLRVVNELAGRDLTSFLHSWLGPGPLPAFPSAPFPPGSDPPAAIGVTTRSGVRPRSVVVAPERAPRRPEARQLAGAGVLLGPVRGGQSEG